MIGLALPKMEVVRVGFVGLGMRGPGAVERFTHIPGTQIVALCDYEQGRAEACQKYLKQASLPKAAVYSGEKGYEELCKRDDIDLVYIATDWLHHFPVAMCAMENGKNVAIEVPSAMNLKECWGCLRLLLAEDLQGANAGAQPATCTFFRINAWRHVQDSLVERNGNSLCLALSRFRAIVLFLK